MESQIWGGWIKITMRTFFPRFPKRWNFSILQVFMIYSTADWVGCPCPVSCFPKIAFIKWNYQDAVETVIHKVINRLNCFQGPLCTPLSPLGHCLEEGTLPLWALSTLCVHSPCHQRMCLAALGWGAGVQGRAGGLGSLCTCPTPSSPGTHAGHLPESTSETLQHTSSSSPAQKKELNMLNIIA